MTNKEAYTNRKSRLLSDKSINASNRALWKEFFEYEEYKLKRQNNLPQLDDATYKTLLEYTSRLKTVNSWFKNKAWKTLTKEDIKKVYDDVEDGKIKSRTGKPYAQRDTYYKKIMKSKPFELAGKAELAKEVIMFSTKRKEEVRYIEEEDFKKLIAVTNKPLHKFLFWLAWDIGENITSLLKLKKKDFYRQTNEYTKDPEYLVNLPQGILKRSRKTRTEPTNFKETIELADILLADLENNELVFNFEYDQAKQIIQRAVKKTGIRCKPNNERPTWKDLRSGMACHLLRKNWSRDEINARLGHSPSSQQIDKYINFLAIDKGKPKRKLFNNDLEKVKDKLDTVVDKLKERDKEIKELKEGKEMALKSIENIEEEMRRFMKLIPVLDKKRIGK